MKRKSWIILVGILIFVKPLIAGEEVSRGKKILMIIAHKDFRDEELFVPKNYFEKMGWEVDVASTDTSEAKGMLGKKIKPDLLIEEVDPLLYDAVILVGGVGSSVYWNDKEIHSIFKRAYDGEKIIGAICIAPVTLAKAGILKERKATCWRSVSNELRESGVNYLNEDVVIDGKIVTASGPKAALKFAEAVASLLKKEEKKN
jgi:protease I